MNRDQKIKIAMVVCAVVLACAVILTATGWFGGGGFGSYANADKYTAGGTEISETVKNLEVHWTSGKITVAYGGNTVKLEETAKRELKDDEKLQWWLDGDTLRVQFTRPGIRLNMPGKELTITLPEGTEFDSASLQLTSGDLEVPAIKAGKLELASTSGDITAAAEVKTGDFNSTSGNVKITLTGEADSVGIGSTSGSVSLEGEKVKTVKAGSTSGGIGVTLAETEKVKAGSTSGNITITLQDFSELEAGATSGSVNVKLPEEPGFTAEIGMTSGKLSSDIALSKDGDKYICGDGSRRVKIGTTSGNVRIEPAGEK